MGCGRRIGKSNVDSALMDGAVGSGRARLEVAAMSSRWSDVMVDAHARGLVVEVTL